MTAQQRLRNGIPYHAVTDICNRFKWTGDPVADGRRLNGEKVLTQGAKGKLRNYIRDHPELYLDEMQSMLVRDGERRYAVSTLCNYFIRIGITCKALDRRARQRDAILRAHWRIITADIPRNCFVFIDEVGVNSDDAKRRRGRSYRGTRAVLRQFFGRGERLCGLGAVTWLDGVLAFELLLENVNHLNFDEFMCKKVVPKLNSYDLDDQLPNSVVVLDNASYHHDGDSSYRKMMEAKGAKVLFLPPYSPDFNPIEVVWHDLKDELKRLGISVVRLDPSFWVRHVMDNIARAHVRSYFRKCGYHYVEEKEEEELVVVLWCC